MRQEVITEEERHKTDAQFSSRQEAMLAKKAESRRRKKHARSGHHPRRGEADFVREATFARAISAKLKDHNRS